MLKTEVSTGDPGSDQLKKIRLQAEVEIHKDKKNLGP